MTAFDDDGFTVTELPGGYSVLNDSPVGEGGNTSRRSSTPR
ncbi:hypothetical protein [Amycolatopsis thermoflava]